MGITSRTPSAVFHVASFLSLIPLNLACSSLIERRSSCCAMLDHSLTVIFGNSSAIFSLVANMVLLPFLLALLAKSVMLGSSLSLLMYSSKTCLTSSLFSKLFSLSLTLFARVRYHTICHTR